MNSDVKILDSSFAPDFVLRLRCYVNRLNFHVKLFTLLQAINPGESARSTVGTLHSSTFLSGLYIPVKRHFLSLGALVEARSLSIFLLQSICTVSDQRDMVGTVLSPKGVTIECRKRLDSSASMGGTSQDHVSNRDLKPSVISSEDSGAKPVPRSAFLNQTWSTGSVWTAAVAALREKSSSIRLPLTATGAQWQKADVLVTPSSHGAVTLRPTMSADMWPSETHVAGLATNLERVDEESPTSNHPDTSADNPDISISCQTSNLDSHASAFGCTRRVSAAEKALASTSSSPISTSRTAARVANPQGYSPRHRGLISPASSSPVHTTLRTVASASAGMVTRAISCPLEKVGFLAKSTSLKEKID